jgi:cytochrome P450
MVLHPEIQAKAQGEIDSVCAGRLPDFSDRSRLPYVDAIVKELLRWNPVLELGMIPP